MEFFNPKKRKTQKVLKQLKPETKAVHKNPLTTSSLTEAQKRRLRRGKPHQFNKSLSL
tara:strand:+ start:321 stop:494 length:174 start_codon:yes stop_codon:yes gene_type:complete